MTSKTSIHSWLIKVDRISAWILFFLFIIFIVTGYSMTREYGMNKLVGIRSAVSIHLGICELVIFFFVIHSGIRIYFALRRWGIIKR